MFKLGNRHKRFEYVPRYYDPRKEALEKKIKQAQAEAKGTKDNDNIAREIKFKSTIEDRWGDLNVKKQRSNSNLRLILILGVIIGIFYYLFVGIDAAGMLIEKLK
tara:strand:- start:21 stop:335 length:315 start_codon:yes stop_codon:yes gene_type:complete